MLWEAVDSPLWTYDATLGSSVYFELDTIGNVRRLRGGKATVGGTTLASDLGGYRFTAFGRLNTTDTTTPYPAVGSKRYDQPIRWQGHWFVDAGPGFYDFRARMWSPDLATFLQPDEYGFLTPTGTLWSWPGQNPFKWRDPGGRGPAENLAGWALDNLTQFSPVPGGAANDNATPLAEAETEAEGAGASPLAAGVLAAASLGVFAQQVQGLAHDLFEKNDREANALARAAAAARPAAGGAGEPPDGPECGPRRPRHHIFPQEFRAQFEAAGIDIDDYTIEMSSEGHAGLHGPGEWNGNWDEFLNAGPARSPQEIVDHAAQMLNDYGLQNEPFVPYK